MSYGACMFRSTGRAWSISTVTWTLRVAWSSSKPSAPWPNQPTWTHPTGAPPPKPRADALVEVCRRYTRADEKKGRRRPAQVLVTIPWNTLETGEGIVDTEAGPISAGTARRLCCDATVSRVLLDPESVPVEMGRATRIVPPALRRDAGAAETSTAPTRDAPCPPDGARPTTSNTGPKAAPRAWPTSSCCAPDTTPSPTRTTGTPRRE